MLLKQVNKMFVSLIVYALPHCDALFHFFHQLILQGIVVYIWNMSALPNRIGIIRFHNAFR